MIRKYVLVVLLNVVLYLPCKAQHVDSTILILKKVANKIIADTKLGFEGVYNSQYYASYKNIVPDTIQVKFASQYGNWHYSNGVLNVGMLNLGSFLNDTTYTQYAINHINFGFENVQFFKERFKNNMPHNKYPLGELFTMNELDDFGAMGASIAVANALQPNNIYQAYITKAANHLLNNRLRHVDSTWVRKKPKPNTLWADDLYMGVSLLSQMGKYTGNNKYFDDAILQVKNFTTYLFNSNKQLYWHCYYTHLQQNGVAHWGRANGWVLMSKIHLLKALPQNHPEKNWLIKNLQQQIFGIITYQNSKGLWHQLLDKNDSYEEASCTAMFVYGIAAAINNGWLPKSYAGAANNGWKALINYMLTSNGELKNICIGTNIEDNLQYYYGRPTVVNDKHGIGVLLDAGIEICKLNK